MSSYITNELPMKITHVDGTTLYIGIGPLGFVYLVTMVSSAVNAGQVICAEGANCVIPRQDYTASDTIPKQHLRGVIGTATNTLGPTLGVAIEKCASNANGEVIRVAGAGSIVAVETTANGTLGQYCNRAAAGQVTPAGTVTPMIGAGFVAKIGSITGGTGNKLGMLVQPL